ncbi:MAG: 30S ribosomal protein S8 [Clostridiales bacterium]|uniref:Small ribosomal subunit protein uS8 n=1 Tax=Harryflintia acetispora TaxID=1849041 RepID=A0A9X8Y9D8_9FIRM|nr:MULTISPECIES: 30S ribosomal protein S8 [Oscillospiraceae]PWM36387.1 MAG: 30S ribosomal protein S8 [Clostridiales bacterium]RGB68741.1 30S ribosomal protein S8 [Harryflintia acetispora]TCL45441.1 small subunit ribosomal protein S8 [Harryflintia acetispora]
MYLTDTVADMLTRIRNANSAKHDTVDIPASKMKAAIAQILLDEGYIKSFQNVDDGKQGIIRIALKYGPNKSQVITGLRRVSKPGLRIYTSCKDAPKVMKGLGIAILSTPKGIMTDKTARKENVGGEVLAFVW